MGMFETTEKILGIFLSRVPGHVEGVNNLALAIRAQDRVPEAIEYLRNFLAQHPGHANLWNSLGSMVSDNGDPENAEIFYR
jgi:cytochrome c-type biogenesis protein CcmH/NrfG